MARPCLVFAHGAGAPSASAWMQGWRRRLEALGAVELFDYPYMQAKRKRPDPHALLVQAHRAAVERALATHGEPIVLAGKSMGSRIGCHVAAERDAIGRKISALVCFGYPLKGQSGKLRDQVLLELSTPILFVQGSRDALCPLELLEATRAKMTAKSQLYLVDGGDHSLVVQKTVLAKNGVSQADIDAGIFDAIREFVKTSVAL